MRCLILGFIILSFMGATQGFGQFIIFQARSTPGGDWLDFSKGWRIVPIEPKLGQTWSDTVDFAVGDTPVHSRVMAVDTTVTVPAGTFFPCIRMQYIMELPDSTIEVMAIYAEDVGELIWDSPGGTSALTSYTIFPGILGYFPLGVGNTWSYGGQTETIDAIVDTLGNLCYRKISSSDSTVRYYRTEGLTYLIIDFDTLNGYPGFVQMMTINDSLHETDFLFEENGYIRWYGFKMAWQDTFYLLPDSTYFVKSDSLKIGESWNSWVGGPTKAVVVDTATISVSAGTFFSYIIEHRLKSAPDSIVATLWFSINVGWVKGVVRGDTLTLDNYLLLGGTGYYPLCVGNWWCFGGATGNGIEEGVSIPHPSGFCLSQNYPNPFNPITHIRYALPKDCQVKLEVYNILGQKVATLVDGEQKAGYKTARWDAGSFSSGIYFYHLQAGDFVQTRKMILLK